MIEKSLLIWNELPQQAQLIIFEISKLGLLLSITLFCIFKLKRWFILSGLDSCFKLSSSEQEKTTPATTWLSTGLATGLCLSSAIIVHDKFILKVSYWNIERSEILINFWGSALFYLLLMCLFKKAIFALSELLKSPVIENYIEKKLATIQSNQSYSLTEPIAPKAIDYACYTIYFGVSWLLGFLLVIEVFNLHLLSALTQSLLFSLGDLTIALLMLLLGFKFFTHQRAEENASLYERQSILMMASCVLFGALIISGSVSTFSILPWLLFVIMGYFLIKYEANSFLDLIAGIFLRLKSVTPPDENVPNETNNFRITKLGVLVSEVSHSPGKKETINNSKLLSIKGPSYAKL